jgi:hypothetical protein
VHTMESLLVDDMPGVDGPAQESFRNIAAGLPPRRSQRAGRGMLRGSPASVSAPSRMASSGPRRAGAPGEDERALEGGQGDDAEVLVVEDEEADDVEQTESAARNRATLETYFGLTLAVAAVRHGCSPQVFRRKCRKVGILEWPAPSNKSVKPKLRAEDAREIFAHRFDNTKVLSRQLAERFGISMRSVQKIWTRDLWKEETQYVFNSTPCMICSW